MSMKQCFADRQFLDDMTRPLVSGRVTFFVHDSNALADISTLEGDTYVQAQNPQILDETGRLQASLFMDLGVYDVKVEKYNGIDDSYEDFDWFEFGLDARIDQIGKTEVADIAELADLDPSVSSKVVTVESYPRRDYIWDPDAVDIADGGVVIGSDVTSEGRWLLLWDCPYLPSSVYGVEHGDITNINALFSYSRYIGSANIVTPPCILLEPGTYNLGNTYVCTKKLAVQPGTQFTGCVRVPCDVEIMGRGASDTWIGNFYFDAHNCTAHSSWYANVEDFWQSGADTFIVDNENYFASRALSSIVDLTDKVVHGPATRVSTYQNHAHFIVAPSTDLPDMFFNPSLDCVRVSGDIGDNIFLSTGTWDPGRIVDGHRVQYDVAPDLDKFANADRWYYVMDERRRRISTVVWTLQTLDLQGRTINYADMYDNGWTSIKNGTVNLIHLSGQYCTLYNVACSIIVDHSGVGAIVSALESTVTIQAGPVGLIQIAGVRSSVYVEGPNGIDPYDTSVNMTGGQWSGAIKLSDDHADTYTRGKNVSFRDVTFVASEHWYLNFLVMEGCYGDVKVDLYPANGGDSKYYYWLSLKDNHFIGSSRIWLTMWGNNAKPHTEIAGNVKFGAMVVINNRFDTSDAYGIKLLRIHPYALVRLVDHPVGTWEYHGNSGNCPRLSPGRLRGNGTDWETVGSELKWRRYKLSTFNVWSPYLQSLTTMDVAYEPTGLSGEPALMAVWENTIGGAGDVYLYAYQGIPLGADEWDENVNNQFINYVGIGRDYPNLPPPDIDSGYVWFPGYVIE